MSLPLGVSHEYECQWAMTLTWAILAGPRDVHNDHITHTHIHTVREIRPERVRGRAIP